MSRLSVDELHLLGTSQALDLDKKPGTDGMGIRIYASSRKQKQPVRIVAGTMELLLFDGNVRREQIGSARPLRVWSYSADDLRQHEQKTSIGVSYAFVPVWSETPPKRDRITIAARYTNAPGIVIYSAPVSVPLAGR